MRVTLLGVLASPTSRSGWWSHLCRKAERGGLIGRVGGWRGTCISTHPIIAAGPSSAERLCLLHTGGQPIRRPRHGCPQPTDALLRAKKTPSTIVALTTSCRKTRVTSPAPSRMLAQFLKRCGTSPILPPFTEVPFADPRSCSTNPCGVSMIRACRRDTVASSITTSLFGRRPRTIGNLPSGIAKPSLGPPRIVKDACLFVTMIAAPLEKAWALYHCSVYIDGDSPQKVPRVVTVPTSGVISCLVSALDTGQPFIACSPQDQQGLEGSPATEVVADPLAVRYEAKRAYRP